MVSAVISSCFLEATFSAPASGLSEPHAMECIRTRSVPTRLGRRRFADLLDGLLALLVVGRVDVEELALAAGRRDLL